MSGQKRLHRAPDYSLALHAATDRYEAAADALSNVHTSDGLGAAMIEYEVAHKEYGRLVLQLHNQRQASHQDKQDVVSGLSISEQAHQHAVALEQCAIFAADHSQPTAQAMVEAAKFLRRIA